MHEKQTRKIIRVGNSFAVTIPKDWLTYYERKKGHKIREVTVEANGSLIIRLILKDSEEVPK